MTVAEASFGTAGLTGGPVEAAVVAARHAQRSWVEVPLRERLRRLRQFRHRIAAAATELAGSIHTSDRTEAEKLASEVIPLADAVQFVEREAARVLRPRRLGRRGRPAWLGRTHLEIRREPFGVVLIVSPSNYPLFLPGVQLVHALAAGNAVVVKPAPGHSEPVRRLRELIDVDPTLFAILSEDVGTVRHAIRTGVDKVVLTGSAETGELVLRDLAPHLTPATMELSGHDAVFVCADADLDLAAGAIAYGLMLNNGNTCIAPRRVFVPRNMACTFEAKLTAKFHTGRAAPAVSIVPVTDMENAIALSGACPYGLGATIFGSRDAAARVAARVNAGCVVVNDMIVPTADPRLPFGGRGRSGFGVTRGAEGLLEMTQVKAIATRGGRFRPHLEPPHPSDVDLFRHYLAAAHGPSLMSRLRGAAGVARTLMRRTRP